MNKYENAFLPKYPKHAATPAMIAIKANHIAFFEFIAEPNTSLVINSDPILIINTIAST